MTRATKVQKLGFAKIVAINLNQLLRFLDFKTFSNSLLRKISFFSTFAILKRLWILICSQTFFCFKSASINFAAILNLNFVLASEAQNFILSLNSAQKNIFVTSLSRKSCFCKSRFWGWRDFDVVVNPSELRTGPGWTRCILQNPLLVIKQFFSRVAPNFWTPHLGFVSLLCRLFLLKHSCLKLIQTLANCLKVEARVTS